MAEETYTINDVVPVPASVAEVANYATLIRNGIVLTGGVGAAEATIYDENHNVKEKIEEMDATASGIQGQVNALKSTTEKIDSNLGVIKSNYGQNNITAAYQATLLTSITLPAGVYLVSCFVTSNTDYYLTGTIYNANGTLIRRFNNAKMDGIFDSTTESTFIAYFDGTTVLNLYAAVNYIGEEATWASGDISTVKLR